jgi:DNA invertase Pin-like site-specific DNA recombinase
MPQAYGYIRTCNTRQLYSADAQRESIRQYFESHLKERNFEWGGFHEDAATSGGVPLCSRPEGNKLDTILERGDAVVFTKLDPGFCSLRDALDVFDRWKDRGIQIHILDPYVDTSSSIGNLFVNAMAQFTKFKRTMMSERAANSIAHRRSQGRPISGKAPYGFKSVGPDGDRRYVRDPFARRIGKFVVKWKLAGASFREIYWHLIRHGNRNRKGKEWSLMTLHSMFQSECRLLQRERGGASVLARWRKAGANYHAIQRTQGPKIWLN